LKKFSKEKLLKLQLIEIESVLIAMVRVDKMELNQPALDVEEEE